MFRSVRIWHPHERARRRVRCERPTVLTPTCSCSAPPSRSAASREAARPVHADARARGTRADRGRRGRHARVSSPRATREDVTRRMRTARSRRCRARLARLEKQRHRIGDLAREPRQPVRRQHAPRLREGRRPARRRRAAPPPRAVRPADARALARRPRRSPGPTMSCWSRRTIAAKVGDVDKPVRERAAQHARQRRTTRASRS